MKDTQTALTVAAFRREVKIGWPYVTIKIRAVTFDGRESRKCLTVTGDRDGDIQHINALAARAGIQRDGNIRFK